MLRLAKIVRFPERHCPSTVVDGAGALGFAQGEFCLACSPFLYLCGAQQSGIPSTGTAKRVSMAPAMPYSLTVG